jgi:hypothetical protein
VAALAFIRETVAIWELDSVIIIAAGSTHEDDRRKPTVHESATLSVEPGTRSKRTVRDENTDVLVECDGRQCTAFEKAKLG